LGYDEIIAVFLRLSITAPFSFAGTFFVTVSAFTLCSLAFMLLDYAQWPKFLIKYKINPGKNAPPPTQKVIKVCTYVGSF
jgi:hypothetical protein